MLFLSSIFFENPVYCRWKRSYFDVLGLVGIPNGGSRVFRLVVSDFTGVKFANPAVFPEKFGRVIFDFTQSKFRRCILPNRVILADRLPRNLAAAR